MTGEGMRRPDGALVGAPGGSAAPATPAGAGPVTLRPSAKHGLRRRTVLERPSLRVSAVVEGVVEDVVGDQVKLDNFEERKRSFPNLSRSAKTDMVETLRLLRVEKTNLNAM